MHCVDCNGVANIIIGTILVLLVVSRRELGGTQQARLDNLNARRKIWYTDTHCESRMPDMKLSWLWAGSEKEKSFACLHGMAVKAANTRALIPWVRELASEFFNGTDQHDTSVRKVTDSLDGMVQVLYNADIFLTASEKVEVAEHILRFGRHMQWLASNSTFVSGQLLWHITPKCHMMQHLSEQADLCNPRWIQAYLEESIVGETCKIYAKAAVGPDFPEVREHNTLLKYLVVVLLRAAGGHQ